MSEEGSGKPPTPPPAGSPGNALFELDAPDVRISRAPSKPVGSGLSRPPVRPDSSPLVTELLSLDAPVLSDPPPEVASDDTDAASGGELDAAISAALEAADRAQADLARPERLVSLAPPEPARTADEQLAQRRARVADRIATLRDSLRFLGELGVADDQRKAVARSLLEVQTAVGGSQAANVLKEPKQSLASAAKETLDSAESMLGPIEDKLLALDDTIGDSVVEACVRATQNKKLVARYARLLASRRLPAGQRRNRFEWIATQLLTRTSPAGELLVLPPDRARNVLNHLLGGVPRKLRKEEIDAATTYLYEAGERLDALRSPNELFTSGWFADVHGYKVSQREHLSSSELLYRSVLLEAKLHNTVERLVTDQAAQNANTTVAELRAHLRRRMLAERDDVDGRLGARARTTLTSTPAPEPAASGSLAPKRRSKPESDAPARKRRSPWPKIIDRVVLIGAPLMIVLAVSTYFVRERAGLGSDSTPRKLTGEELRSLAPLMVLGDVRGMGSEQRLHGWISGTRWRALDPVARSAAADDLTKKLVQAGIPSAELYDDKRLVIVIRDGELISADGAKR